MALGVTSALPSRDRLDGDTCGRRRRGSMTRAVAFFVIVSAAGCAPETTECCIVRSTMPAQPAPPHPPPPPPEVSPPTEIAAAPSARVIVLQSNHIDRLTEVVGVIDVHAEMGGHDAALEMLKQRAAQLGADAVLGVEFHHGHGEEEPTHLSGLAVRFIDQVQ
jgi:hypothetical protein